MRHRTIEGRLLYRGPGGERGREWFAVTVHGDGRRLLRARTEIDDGEVLRDVTHTLDPRFRPIDCTVRLQVEDRFVGTGWFWFDEQRAIGECVTAVGGRLSQRIDTPGRARGFGSHALVSDGILTAAHDPAGPACQRIENAFLSSYAFNGATGPMLCPIAFGLEYLGTEAVEVPAGRFRCERYRYLLDDSAVAGHPPYEVWVSADGDRVLVRAEVAAPKDFVYELDRIERR
jgi:Protein of unknown function (DUF3108)